jgi:hypothetical protein
MNIHREFMAMLDAAEQAAENLDAKHPNVRTKTDFFNAMLGALNKSTCNGVSLVGCFSTSKLAVSCARIQVALPSTVAPEVVDRLIEVMVKATVRGMVLYTEAVCSTGIHPASILDGVIEATLPGVKVTMD